MGLIIYGKITKKHGLLGEVKVHVFSGDFDNLKNLKQIYIETPSDRNPQKFNITNVRTHKNSAIVKIKGINTPEIADKFKNCHLLVEEKNLFELRENEYYWYKLIGLRVYNSSNEYIGTVINLLDNTAQEILVIKNEKSGNEYLVPFVSKFILDINLDKSKIIIEQIEGLLG